MGQQSPIFLLKVKINKLELFLAVTKEKDFERGLKLHPNAVPWYCAHHLSDMTTMHVPKCVGVNFILLGVLCRVYSRKQETDEKFTFLNVLLFVTVKCIDSAVFLYPG
jgi:hypothetical protein